jgi:hypothetical protein
MHWSSAYLRDYGAAILQGDAEFRAEALLGLAGWRGELSPIVADKMRLIAAQHATREGFLLACREAGLTMGGSLG